MISDWSDLQTVLAIANAGSLSAAARALGVSQSTISRRLQAIEMELGQPVFERSEADGFVPNALGERLVDTARRMRDLVSDANADMGGDPAPVRVACCEVTAQAFVAPALARWAQETGGRSDLAVYDNLFVLKPDDYDVLVTPLDSAPDNLTGKRIATMEWGYYASVDYLSRHPVVSGTTGFGGHDVIHPSGSLADVAAYAAFKRLGGKIVFSASSPIAHRDAAARGMGIAMLPAVLAEEAPELRRLDIGDTPISEIWTVARSPNTRHPRVSAFLDWTHGYFRKGATRDRADVAI